MLGLEVRKKKVEGAQNRLTPYQESMESRARINNEAICLIKDMSPDRLTVMYVM